MYMQCTFLVHAMYISCTCNVHFLYAKRVAQVQSTSLRRHNAVKGCSLRASLCKAATAFSRRRLVHCTNDRKSNGVRSRKVYNTLRTRQFPHMHNAVSSLIACEDTIMCKGGNGLARIVAVVMVHTAYTFTCLITKGVKA